jgi:hypothetical protein
LIRPAAIGAAKADRRFSVESVVVTVPDRRVRSSAMSPARRCCRWCGTALAHDNADTACSPCARKHPADAVPVVPVEFWQTALMGSALASGNLGWAIRVYRSHPSHGRPLPQHRVARWLHVSQATLHRIETGKRPLTIDEIHSFTRALGMPVALRWVTDLGQAREDVDPISRRSLLGAGVGAATGLTATTAPAAARQVDPELVAHWTRLMSVLSRHDAMFGPHDVLGAVRHEIGLIAEHRQVARGALRGELMRVESQWAEFASWLSNDAGVRGRDVWADRALRLAQEAGYPDMVAWVLMRRSQWACNRPDPHRVVAFAQTARRASASSGRVRALCALQEAQGHALARNPAACERAVADAYGLLDADAPGTPRPDVGGRDVTRPYVLAAEARCWVRLRPRRAIGLLEEALGLWPRDRTRGRGIHHARLALACAADGEPERAAAEGVKAVTIARATRSDLTMRELRRLDHDLAASDAPGATAFREAFAAL